MSRNLLVLAMLFLTACSNWPKAGTGGLAEWDKHWSTLETPHAQDPRLLELRKDIFTANQTLDDLFYDGAKKCHPASFNQVVLLRNRTMREFAGKLYTDSATHLRQYQGALITLRRSLSRNRYAIRCKALATKEVHFDKVN